MVNLTRIYTRTGDDGTTGLGDGSRTSKTDPRLIAFADVDETNAALGVALAIGGLDDELAAFLWQVSNDLFDVGADLATPLSDSPAYPPLRVTQAYVDALEEACDRFNAGLEPLRSFILPGGTPAAAALHVTRTVARRAERSVWTALDLYGDQAEGGVNRLAATYLNRLSDLLFIAARLANAERGDVLWQPGGTRQQQPEG